MALVPDCPFCQLITTGEFTRSTDHAVAFPDAYPVSKGHTLVVPRSHVASIYDLGEKEQAGLWALVAAVREELADRFAPDGFNIGVNDGEAAGQTVGHAHVHVIPRWDGDVEDPRGGIRWVVPDRAVYWEEGP